MSNTLPEPWRGPADRKGITSARGLADRAGVAPSTITLMINGTRETQQDTIAKVADALGLSVTKVSGWVGQARTVEAPWIPPQEAHLLTRDERDAINALITAIARPRRSSTAPPESKPRRLHAAREAPPDREYDRRRAASDAAGEESQD